MIRQQKSLYKTSDEHKRVNGCTRQRIIFLGFLSLIIGAIFGCIGLILSSQAREEAIINPPDKFSLVHNASIIYHHNSHHEVGGTLQLLTVEKVDNPSFTNATRKSYVVSIDISQSMSNILKVYNEMKLCFTNNIYFFEDSRQKKNKDYENNDAYYTFCVNGIHTSSSKKTYSLSSNFDPQKFGAAVLLSMDGYTSFGDCIYEEKYQRSLYSTLGNTTLQSTTDDYYITGSIRISGKVGRTFSTLELKDVPTIKFLDIQMHPIPPALYLYLTNRPNWIRFNPNDIFVSIPGNPHDGFPEGSFNYEGTYSIDWPHDDTIDIQNFKNGYWYLWCETFAIVLAGGSVASN